MQTAAPNQWSNVHEVPCVYPMQVAVGEWFASETFDPATQKVTVVVKGLGRGGGGPATFPAEHQHAHVLSIHSSIGSNPITNDKTSPVMSMYVNVTWEGGYGGDFVVCEAAGYTNWFGQDSIALSPMFEDKTEEWTIELVPNKVTGHIVITATGSLHPSTPASVTLLTGFGRDGWMGDTMRLVFGTPNYPVVYNFFYSIGGDFTDNTDAYLAAASPIISPSTLTGMIVKSVTVANK